MIDVEKIFDTWKSITGLEDLSFEFAEIDEDKGAIHHLQADFRT